MMHSPMRFENLAVAVALLSDLRHLKQRIPAGKPRADRQIPEIISFHDQVFPEGRAEYPPLCTEGFYFFIRQRLTWRCQCPACASPSMPQSSTSFAVSTSCFCRSPFFTDTDSYDFSHFFCFLFFSEPPSFHPPIPDIRWCSCHILRPLKAVFHRLFKIACAITSRRSAAVPFCRTSRRSTPFS